MANRLLSKWRDRERMLTKSKSSKAFVSNLKAELAAGKPRDQALAIAYSVKRRAAEGGSATWQKHIQTGKQSQNIENYGQGSSEGNDAPQILGGDNFLSQSAKSYINSLQDDRVTSVPKTRASGGATKSSKPSVHYRVGHGKTRCANCTMFVNPNRCTSVSGVIKPSDLCDLFDAKKKYATGGKVEKGLYLVRHGATKFNNNVDTSIDRIRGWIDVPLSPEGRAEAEKVAKELDGKGVDVIVSSDLSRAKETAQIIAKKIGCKVIYNNKLRPWDLGVISGTHTKEALPKIEDYVKNKPTQAVPKGESFNQFKNRAFQGLHEVATGHTGKSVAFVTHHRNERLIKAWMKAGQPANHAIDLPTFLTKGERTGHAEKIDIKHRASGGQIKKPMGGGLDDPGLPVEDVRFHKPTTSIEDLPPPKKATAHVAGEEPEQIGNDKVDLPKLTMPQQVGDPFEPNMQDRLARGALSAARYYQPDTTRGTWERTLDKIRGPGVGPIPPPPSLDETMRVMSLLPGPLGAGSRLLSGVRGLVNSLPTPESLPPSTPPLERPVSYGGMQFTPQQWQRALQSKMPENLAIGSQGFTNVPEGAMPLTPGRPLNYSPWKMQSPPPAAGEPSPSNISPYDTANKQRVWDAAMKARQDQLVQQLREKGELDAATGPLVNGMADGGGASNDDVSKYLSNLLDNVKQIEGTKVPLPANYGASMKYTTGPRRPIGFLSGAGGMAAGGFTETPKTPSPTKIGSNPTGPEQVGSYRTSHMISGFLHSRIPGRTDKIGLNVRNGSYVMPADIVSHYGQGNSLAGADALGSLFKMGPYGSSLPKIGVSRPNIPRLMPIKQTTPIGYKAKGGPTHVPVLAAGGEFIVDPETVRRIGGGNAERGFRILDKFVLESRKKLISTLKKLKPPKKD